jgi:hypothetical protein
MNEYDYFGKDLTFISFVSLEPLQSSGEPE